MEISFLKLILLAGAFQGLVLALLLVTRQGNRTANRMLAALLVLLSFHLVLVGFDERAFMMKYPHLSHITWVMPALYGPLVLLFLGRMTRLAPAFRRRELLYFLPFLGVFFLELPYFLESAQAKRAYLDDYARSVEDDFGLVNQLVNILHIVFFGLCLLLYRKHLRNIRDFYSDLSKVRMDWMGHFLYISFGIVLFSIFVFYARKFNWPFLAAFYPWHFLGIVAIIYWMAYRALSQPELFSGMPEGEMAGKKVQGEAAPAFADSAAPPAATGLSPAMREALAARLEELMEEEKLYLDSELTLQGLCDRLQANRQYVSETLNSHLGKNFYDFVNDYRIAEFQRLVRNPANSHLTILALAYESGFNSKATFNAVFKKKTGLTPSAYLQQARAEPGK